MSLLHALATLAGLHRCPLCDAWTRDIQTHVYIDHAEVTP